MLGSVTYKRFLKGGKVEVIKLKIKRGSCQFVDFKNLWLYKEEKMTRWGIPPEMLVIRRATHKYIN